MWVTDRVTDWVPDGPWPWEALASKKYISQDTLPLHVITLVISWSSDNKSHYTPVTTGRVPIITLIKFLAAKSSSRSDDVPMFVCVCVCVCLCVCIWSHSVLFGAFRVFEARCFEWVAMLSQGCLFKVSRMFQESFKGVNRKFQGCFKEVSMVF